MVCLQLTACSSELANFSGLFRRELFRDSAAISLCAFEGISMQTGAGNFRNGIRNLGESGCEGRVDF